MSIVSLVGALRSLPSAWLETGAMIPSFSFPHCANLDSEKECDPFLKYKFNCEVLGGSEVQLAWGWKASMSIVATICSHEQ